ncbi:MAG: ApaG domain [archaeon]|nr:ApaG domain [archaeon]
MSAFCEDDTVGESGGKHDLINRILDADELVCVFAMLPWRDLLVAGQVCRTWKELTRTSSLWRGFCEELGLLPTISNSISASTLGLSSSFSEPSPNRGTSVWQVAQEWLHEWPEEYLASYRKGKELWSAIHARYEVPLLPAPNVAENAKGLRHAEESVLKRRLPLEYKTFLRLAPAELHRFPHLLGYRAFYEQVLAVQLLSLKQFSAICRRLAEGASHAPIAVSSSSRVALFLDLSSGAIQISWGPELVPYASGLFGLLDWLLTMPLHPVHRCPELWPPENRVAAVTRGLAITATSSYIIEHSDPTRFLWAYQIEFDMPAGLPEDSACRLVSRHWRIEDANGVVEEIDGPGVIGLFPTCTPGMDTFKYASCCPLSTPSGSMRGTFTMTVLSTGQEFQAAVPEMHFYVPGVI